MQMARLRWLETRKKLKTALQGLEQAVKNKCIAMNNDPYAEYEIDIGEVTSRSQELYTLLDTLDERLVDKLDEALNAKTPEVRRKKHQEALAILKDYTTFIHSEPFIDRIDESGFAPTKIKQTCASVLTDLSSKLGDLSSKL